MEISAFCFGYDKATQRNAFNFRISETLFGIWTWGWPLWWIIKPSPTKVIVLSAGTLDNNKNGRVGGGEGDGGGRWNNRSVRSLYCTQNNSAPQDSSGNNMLCHCVCNYTQEGMCPDWLLCQSCPHLSGSTPPCCIPTQQLPPFPNWHFLLEPSDFSCNDFCATFLEILAAYPTCVRPPRSALCCDEHQCVV